ncbi:hypothetical protein V6Z11_A08G212100 [Gossypium hirsutum]
MDKKIKALGLINYPTSSHFNTTGAGPIDLTVGNAYAAAHYVKHNFGAKTIMNVWSPTTLSDQASFAYLWIANGPADALNVVQAGWGLEVGVKFNECIPLSELRDPASTRGYS